MSFLVTLALVFEFSRFQGASTLAMLVVFLAAGSLATFFFLAPILRLASRGLHRWPLAAGAASLVERTATEIARAARGIEILILLVLSFAIRAVKFGAYWMLLLAVLHERGITAADLPFWRVFLGIAGAELSATLPVHGVAGFGTYEAAWALGFSHLGLDRETAILSGFATHLLSQAYDYSIGLLALLVILAMSRQRRA